MGDRAQYPAIGLGGPAGTPNSKQCGACGITRPRDDFTRSQYKKQQKWRRCKRCAFTDKMTSGEREQEQFELQFAQLRMSERMVGLHWLMNPPIIEHTPGSSEFDTFESAFVAALRDAGCEQAIVSYDSNANGQYVALFVHVSMVCRSDFERGKPVICGRKNALFVVVSMMRSLVRF